MKGIKGEKLFQIFNVLLDLVLLFGLNKLRIIVHLGGIKFFKIVILLILINNINRSILSILIVYFYYLAFELFLNYPVKQELMSKSK